MGKKLCISIAIKSFLNVGLMLLDRTYKNTHVPMNYICTVCGYKGTKSLSSVRVLQGCPSCYGNVKKNLTVVQKHLDTFGDIVLEKKYVNSKNLLKCKCSRGHIYYMNWNNISQSTKSRCSECKVQRLSEQNSSYWKGGVKKRNLPLYETYSKQLRPHQNVYLVEQGNLNLLGVGCAYCSKVFVPTATSVRHFLTNIVNGRLGLSNLYCSEECKQACPVYGQVIWPKDNKPYKNTRHDQASWASLVKERDNFICQICGKKEDVMYAHHIDPVSRNPVESADIGNGITLCKTCHKQVHRLPGCSYEELKCKK